MEEILFELREHSYGLNAGRWDYIFSMIKLLPRPARVRAPRPRRRDDDRALHAQLLRAARRHLPPPRRLRDGRHGRADPLAHRPGGQRARGRRGARRQGARGAATASTAPGSRTPTSSASRGPPSTPCSATARTRSTAAATTSRVTAAELLDAGATPGRDHRGGPAQRRRASASSTSRSGSAAAAPPGIDNLMEDAATAEISRSQLWQWIRHGATPRGRARGHARARAGRPRRGDGADPRRRSATRSGRRGRPEETRALFERVALADDFPEFLTLPAYELLD